MKDENSAFESTLLMCTLMGASIILAYLLFLRPDVSALVGIAVYGLFAVVLTIHLARTPPMSKALLQTEAHGSPSATLPKRLTAILLGFGLLIILSLILRQGTILILGTALVALWIIVRQWHQLRRRQVVIGCLIGLCCGTATLLMGPCDRFLAMLHLLTAPLFFITGSLLLAQTGLTQVRMLRGQMRQGLYHFATTGMLSVPLILLNLFSQVSPNEEQIDQWWEPFYAFVPALTEEIWARLFLVTLGFAWLRPVIKDPPGRTIGFAVLLAAFAHGLAHYPATSVPSAIMTSLTVGVPLGMLFVCRDWESAVGYHFFPVFVRFLAALLRG